MISADYVALRQHFIDNFDPDGVAVVYDNQPIVSIPETSPFMRFSVRAGASIHHAGSAQTGVKNQLGRVWLQIFTPASTGDGNALAIADAFTDAFRNKRITSNGSDIQLRTEEINTNPSLSDGYYMITVTIPYDSYRHY